MSIIVKGMQMPENCIVCPMAETGFQADKAVVAEDGTTGVITVVRRLIGRRAKDERFDKQTGGN